MSSSLWAFEAARKNSESAPLPGTSRHITSEMYANLEIARDGILALNTQILTYALALNEVIEDINSGSISLAIEQLHALDCDPIVPADTTTMGSYSSFSRTDHSITGTTQIQEQLIEKIPAPTLSLERSEVKGLLILPFNPVVLSHADTNNQMDLSPSVASAKAHIHTVVKEKTGQTSTDRGNHHILAERKLDATDTELNHSFAESTQTRSAKQKYVEPKPNNVVTESPNANHISNDDLHRYLNIRYNHTSSIGLSPARLPRNPAPLTSPNVDLSFIPIANTINPHKFDKVILDTNEHSSPGQSDLSFQAISTAIRKSFAGKLSMGNFTTNQPLYDSTRNGSENDAEDKIEKVQQTDMKTKPSLRHTLAAQTVRSKPVRKSSRRSSVFVSLPEREPINYQGHNNKKPEVLEASAISKDSATSGNANKVSHMKGKVSLVKHTFPNNQNLPTNNGVTKDTSSTSTLKPEENATLKPEHQTILEPDQPTSIEPEEHMTLKSEQEQRIRLTTGPKQSGQKVNAFEKTGKLSMNTVPKVAPPISKPLRSRSPPIQRPKGHLLNKPASRTTTSGSPRQETSHYSRRTPSPLRTRLRRSIQQPDFRSTSTIEDVKKALDTSSVNTRNQNAEDRASPTSQEKVNQLTTLASDRTSKLRETIMRNRFLTTKLNPENPPQFNPTKPQKKQISPLKGAINSKSDQENRNGKANVYGAKFENVRQKQKITISLSHKLEPPTLTGSQSPRIPRKPGTSPAKGRSVSPIKGRSVSPIKGRSASPKKSPSRAKTEGDSNKNGMVRKSIKRPPEPNELHIVPRKRAGGNAVPLPDAARGIFTRDRLKGPAKSSKEKVTPVKSTRSKSTELDKYSPETLPDIPSEDDVLRSQKYIKSWAETPEILRTMKEKQAMDPVDVFGEVPALRIDDVFDTVASRQRGQASPTKWSP